ncbi:MAG: RNA polymerase sigma factor SigR [Gemmatimonadaceae bacterium]
MASDEERKREKDRQFLAEALPSLPAVTRFALSLTKNETDAEDLVQETFLRAYRSWDQYLQGTECRGWLFTICRNVFLRLRRRESRQLLCDDPELEALAAAAIHASAQLGGYGDLFERIDLSEAIERALTDLADGFREAVILVDVQDQSYETASQVLGVPIGTVRSRLFRGRRLLQEALITYARDAGLAPAEGEFSEVAFESRTP